jgi:hypothetical protein
MQTDPGFRRHLMAGLLVVLCAALLRVTLYTQHRVQEDHRMSLAEANLWRVANQKERHAALVSIRGQLEAFKKGDYQLATRYQSEELRGNFSTAQSFQAMIETIYPQFAHYRTARFGPAWTDREGERMQIPVTLTGQDGVRVHAIYYMVREKGEYRVSGVMGGARPRRFHRRPLPYSAPPGMDA